MVNFIRNTLLIHHVDTVPLWQKILFPVWLFKILMVHKHEAYRFKYDTDSLVYLEQTTMRWVGILLFIAAFLYYVMVLAPPLIFLNECGQGINYISHYVFGTYLLLNIVFEVTVVFII